MLPNWLYGKSKSKLASILDGTPADYNQVKAQVNQNTEDIALLDTSNQALTSQSNSIVNVLGAKNFVALNRSPYRPQTLANVSVINQTEDSVTLTSNAVNYARLDLYYTLPAGQYIVSYDFESDDTSYQPIISIYNDVGGGIVQGGNSIRKNEQRIITVEETHKDLNIRLFITNNNDAVVRTGTYKNFMIRPASITDGTYVPYTMTNQELTEKLTADANFGAAVDLSTYISYSNLYTAPSDGYVHFLSAASGSDARTIYTYGNNTTAATDPHFTHSTSVNNKAFEIFIKKGLKIYVDGLQSGDTINFYPLS